MLQYLDGEDLSSIIQDRHLEQVIGADTTLLERSEISAWEEISAYLRSRYDIVYMKNNIRNYNLLKRMIADVMIYHILKRVTPKNVPEIRYIAYKDAINFARDAAESKVSPPWQEYTNSEGETTKRTGIHVGGNPANQWHY